MRAVIDGRLEIDSHVEHYLDQCLDCRACETACPSGVRYSRLIEPFRLDMEHVRKKSRDDWFRRWILLGLFPYASRLRLALAPARVAQVHCGSTGWPSPSGCTTCCRRGLRSS